MSENTVERSPRFEELRAKYEKNFVTIDTLRGWVKINERRAGKGITAAEFEEITGRPYQATE